MSEKLPRRLAASLRRVLLDSPLVGGYVRRVSAAIGQAPPHSLIGRLAPLRAVLRPPATGSQVLAILDVLDETKIRYWVAGGWGVDALAGRQSRRHDDVDVVLDDFEHTIERAAAALRAKGFTVLERDRRPTWMPDRWLLQDGATCHVELVSLDLDRLHHAHSSEVVPGQGDLVPFDTGMIEGRAVPCLSADAQRIVRSGYRARPADRHDLALLQGLGSSKV